MNLELIQAANDSDFSWAAYHRIEINLLTLHSYWTELNQHWTELKNDMIVLERRYSRIWICLIFEVCISIQSVLYKALYK